MNDKRQFEVIFYGDVINCVRDETGKEYNLHELINLLMEQQVTINELQSIIKHIKCEENCFDYDYCCETVCSLYNEIKHLKEENEQLRQQLKEKEEDERLYANEIVKLNKEAKEVLDFKSLGGDY